MVKYSIPPQDTFMNMEHKFSQHQKILQKLSLTPQMKQSIKLLGMATKDLNEYVESAIDANPFLKKTSEKKEYDYIANIRQEENPRMNLISQIRMFGLKNKPLEIAEYLIYEMDDDGYIKADLEETAEVLSVEKNEVEKALKTIQEMDPPGIGARGVGECLRLQLERMGKKESIEYNIISDFINELAQNDINKISKTLNIDKEKIKSAVSNIKKLNPRPASTLLGKEAQKITPDLIAEIDDKKIYLCLNKEWLPQLKFYNPYENEKDIAKDPQAKKFIKDGSNSAISLIDGLKKREETIYKVANYILNLQKNSFIDNGAEIKTLTIKDVAQALKLHISTISRAISNKYIQVNNEVMPINSLLSKGVRKQDGEITSKSSIKKRIAALIKNENIERPLTDEDIKEGLKKEGIILKRRTVAKYRNSMRILPAYLRKKIES